MALRKIMFVDDDPRILSAMRRRFSNDFNLITFDRGTEAVNYLKSNDDVSVIVADMRMPEMDGLELLKQSQAIRPGLKRIMLTGNSDQKTAIDAINDGRVFRFLKKPCDATEVKAAIELALENAEFANTDLSDIAENVGQGSKDTEQQDLFLSVMSDELRTPLSQVIAISETLNKRDLSINERARTRMLRQIGEAGNVALSRIDRILTFVRLQSSTQEKPDNQIRLDQLIAVEIEQLRSVIGERNITISIDHNAEPIYIKSSEEAVRIGIREALDNAIKFNKDGGHISVQLKGNSSKAAVRITNTGHQVSETSIASNTVFKSSDNSLNRLNYGVGLGLSLIDAAALAGDYQYDIWPRKNGGAWVTFVFEGLPIL